MKIAKKPSMVHYCCHTSLFHKLHRSAIHSAFCLLLLSSSLPLHAQTISEKKAGLSGGYQEMSVEMQGLLVDINRDIKHTQDNLHQLYVEVGGLFHENAKESDYKTLLADINEERRHLISLENHWRDLAIQGGRQESYALWQQPDTTIGQLVMDYGAEGYVYLIPPEVDTIRLSVNSNLPIPRSSWEEMLELILVQNGVGYKQLNPFLRQLFLLREDRSSLRLITAERHDLEFLEPEARISFMLTPEPAEVRRAWVFLEKFVNFNTTSLQMVGRNILIVGQVADIQDLLKLYDFVAANKGDKEYKIFPVRRIDVEEMADILSAIFDHGPSGGEGIYRLPPPQRAPHEDMNAAPRHQEPMAAKPDYSDANGLRVIPLRSLTKALFVVGTKEEIHKAEQIIQQVESQVGEAREKLIYWYTTKHSDPEELAEILQKIYLLISRTGGLMREGEDQEGFPMEIAPLPTSESIAQDIIAKERALLPSELYQTSYYQQGNYVVNPAPVEPRKTAPMPVNKNRDNFIVDQKTGSIAMVVEADLLPKMKDLIKKLDVAKRMVQIEVLLFERRISKQNNFGLNLFKFGSGCKDMAVADCFSWGGIGRGILNLMFAHEKTCDFPAYEVVYRFLMTQDNIHINASPSVVAINQTPATVAIVEEISIDTGIYNVETAKGITLEKAYTRAQYGITLDMTPTVHMTADENGIETDEPNYVTLATDVTFDTVHGGTNPERPDVTRRHITNEVRVPDGQTIILGGLRRKQTDEFKEAIPFFGELPALGKLFSFERNSESETEMFIFLTPTIISDPLDDFERIKCAEMRRRPGDIPEFLCSLERSREMEKNRLLANSMVILLGPEPDRCYTPSYFRPSFCDSFDIQCCAQYLPLSGEYDGR